MMFENGGGEILTNFLKSEGKPICREERQYALFLYNALLDVKRKRNWAAILELMDEDNIEKMLGLDKLKEKDKDDKLKKIELDNIHIKQVFYEATLMRDLFHSCDDKNEFNKKLLEFVLSYTDPAVSLCLVDAERKNYIEALSGDAFFGGPSKSNKLTKIKFKNNSKDFEKNKKKCFIASRLQLAKYMMNATPDILVSYTIDGIEQEYVRAIECKYESGIGVYKDIFGQGRQLQIFVQRLIMSFLFGAEIIVREECGMVKVEKNKDIWKEVYGNLCIDIAKKDNNAENMGVTVVQFTPVNKIIPEGCIEIAISELLQGQYD